MPLSFTNVTLTSGTASASNSGTTANVLAAPGAGKNIRLVSAHITITVAATGGGGLAQLKDGAGGTVIASIDGNALTQHAELFFGEDGYPLGANSVLELAVSGAATAQATSRCTATGFITR